MPLFIREDKDWSNDESENREYRRLAKNWNAIHRAILNQSQPCKTSLIGRGFFFICEEELLLCEGYAYDDPSTVPNWELSVPLYNFDGQGAEDLAELAAHMETWLERPTLVPFPPGFDIKAIPEIPRNTTDEHFSTSRQFLIDA